MYYIVYRRDLSLLRFYPWAILGGSLGDPWGIIRNWYSIGTEMVVECFEQGLDVVTSSRGRMGGGAGDPPTPRSREKGEELA